MNATGIRIVSWLVSSLPFVAVQIVLWRGEAGGVWEALVHRPYLWVLYLVLIMMVAERVFRVLLRVLK